MSTNSSNAAASIKQPLWLQSNTPPSESASTAAKSSRHVLVSQVFAKTAETERALFLSFFLLELAPVFLSNISRLASSWILCETAATSNFARASKKFVKIFNQIDLAISFDCTRRCLIFADVPLTAFFSFFSFFFAWQQIFSRSYSYSAANL